MKLTPGQAIEQTFRRRNKKTFNGRLWSARQTQELSINNKLKTIFASIQARPLYQTTEGFDETVITVTTAITFP